MNSLTNNTPRTLLDTSEKIREIYDLCKKVGLVDNLSKNLSLCKHKYEIFRKHNNKPYGPVYVDDFIPSFASFLDKCHRKGELDDFKIEKEFKKLREESSDNVFVKMSICILIMLEINGDIDSGIAIC